MNNQNKPICDSKKEAKNQVYKSVFIHLKKKICPHILQKTSLCTQQNDSYAGPVGGDEAHIAERQIGTGVFEIILAQMCRKIVHTIRVSVDKASVYLVRVLKPTADANADN